MPVSDQSIAQARTAIRVRLIAFLYTLTWAIHLRYYYRTTMMVFEGQSYRPAGTEWRYRVSGLSSAQYGNRSRCPCR